MSRIERVIEGLERVRSGLCCYHGPTCDCKYGFPERKTTEQTGCPEVRAAVALLRQLQRVTDLGDYLLTYEEWTDVERVQRPSSHVVEAIRQQRDPGPILSGRSPGGNRVTKPHG